MSRYFPLIAVVIFLSISSYFILQDEPSQELNREKPPVKEVEKNITLADFYRYRGCARIPKFLYREGISRPVIDLSQLKYKGIAFLYYSKESRETKAYHKKEWERFDALGTYTLDKRGDIYLTPNPFISIKPDTFNLQKAIYKLDSKSGELTRWLVIEEISPSSRNPYGLISIVYDCDTDRLIVSAIDGTTFKEERGRIYTIDINTKEIIDRVDGFDALTINILKDVKGGKYLIAGSAKDNGVYLFKFNHKNLIERGAVKLFELPDSELRVRKIKIVGKNRLKLEAIRFTYSLIAETSKSLRTEYLAEYNSSKREWKVTKLTH